MNNFLSVLLLFLLIGRLYMSAHTQVHLSDNHLLSCTIQTRSLSIALLVKWEKIIIYSLNNVGGFYPSFPGEFSDFLISIIWFVSYSMLIDLYPEKLEYSYMTSSSFNDLLSGLDGVVGH